MSDSRASQVAPRPPTGFQRLLEGRLLPRLTGALALVALPLYALKVARKHDYTDFSVYYRAAARAQAQHWNQIYNFDDGASPFRYVPLSLPWFSPFAHLSLETAQLVWYALQFAWFGLGILLIATALRAVDSRKALGAACFGALFIFRFCLDCFTIGQISSLLFLGFALGFYGFTRGIGALTGGGLFLPTLFKIGPGFLYLLPVFTRTKERLRSFATPVVALLALNLLALAWCGSVARYGELWKQWFEIVAADSSYYDASHYGSQSIKSALLRLANAHWITGATAIRLYLASAAFGCGAIVFFWALRRPEGARGRALFYALGIFPYLWFMPETFKYSLTPLAIPVAALACAPEIDLLIGFALGFGALTLSVAGLDLVGSRIFFALQYDSIPVLAVFLLALAVLREAARASVSRLSQLKLGPWERLPEAPASLAVSVLVPVPSLLPDPEEILPVLQGIERRLRSRFQASCEILLAPMDGQSGDSCRQLERELRSARVLDPPALAGRAAALRQAFLRSRGSRMLIVQLEQPCDPAFYDQALGFLDSGYDLVRANRRLAESRFRIPVRYLPLVYGRHRLGLAFNRFVRAILPIETSDTHSGSLALTRELALEVFALQTSPAFLFDLELCLVARAQGARELDLPVSLILPEEKEVDRIVDETWAILLGLPRLALRYRRGCYRKRGNLGAITADDWGISPGVNQAVVELARKGIIKRVSLMPNCRHLRTSLEELRAIDGLRIGIHFNLTYGHALSKSYEVRGPRELLFGFALGPSPALVKSVREELTAQLAELRSAGIQPSYFDGHHHIHLVPGLIDAIADLLKEARIGDVRLPYDPALLHTRKFPLVLLSALARRKLDRHGFRYLPCFYPTSEHFRDHGLLRARLAGIEAHEEVIVHPASLDDVRLMSPPDSYSAQRVTEYRALRMLSI